ncbi:MAG TPA: tripartite tricarboxylate transporter substrate binding protein [Pseudolabrys sp.]|jgi:tripartite-type tricarboxylate transporter receptor subunit TctC
MKLERRQFLQFAALAAVLPTAPRLGWAQTYPSHPVRLIVGYTAGGASDVTARVMGQWLSLRLGQPFVIENRPGAATNLATEAVVHAPADGHTLLLISAANAINGGFYPNLNFDFRRDIAPVAAIVRGPMVMVVNPSFPAKTIPELIAYAKARPGQISMASVGVGSPSHLAIALLKMKAGIDVVHVPYRGGALATTDLLGGQVQAFFGTTTAMTEYINAGKFRALAVTAAMRVEALPNVPTIAETIPGYEASDWFGIGAPKGTPTDIIETLNREINAALSDPSMKARLAALHGTLLPGSAGDFAKLIAGETDKWNKTIKLAGIKSD